MQYQLLVQETEYPILVFSPSILVLSQDDLRQKDPLIQKMLLPHHMLSKDAQVKQRTLSGQLLCLTLFPNIRRTWPHYYSTASSNIWQLTTGTFLFWPNPLVYCRTNLQHFYSLTSAKRLRWLVLSPLHALSPPCVFSHVTTQASATEQSQWSMANLSQASTVAAHSGLPGAWTSLEDDWHWRTTLSSLFLFVGGAISWRQPNIEDTQWVWPVS